MRILPVASGKGGVGKSLLAANLAIALGQSGRRVVLADLDLGGSNLHTILGMRSLERGIGTFLLNKDASFDDIVQPTDYDNVRFIPGDAEIPGVANLSSSQKSRLIRRLKALDADFLVLDLGSGTGYNTLDFFLLASRGIVITMPTLTAVLNAYLFLKNAVFRLIDHSFSSRGPAAEFLKAVKGTSATLQRVYIPNLLPELQARDAAGYETLVARRAAFRPFLVMNLLQDPRDAEKADKIRRSCSQYLGVELDHLGVIYRDAAQDTALSAGLPIVAYKPQAVLSQAIQRMADKLIAATGDDLDLPAADDADSGFRTAELEAEVDFEARQQHLRELLHSGALSTGDLVDTVTSQQYEISRLRRENAFLKNKLLGAAEVDRST